MPGVAKQVILLGLMGKLESSYRAVTTVAGATDGILMAGEEALMAISAADDGARAPQIAAGGVWKRTTPRGRTAKFPVNVEVRGAGAAYSASVVPLDTHVMLQASGHSATGSFAGGTENWLYKPISTAWASAYIEAYSRGQKWPIVGCYADFAFEVEHPDITHFRFDTDGLITTTATDVALPAITYNTTVLPPVASGVALTIGSFTGAVVRSIKGKKNQNITPRIDLNDATGHAGFGMGRRRMVLEVVIEQVALATVSPWSTSSTLNPYELWNAAQSFVLSFTVGSTQYNKWTFNAAQAFLSAPPKEGVDANAATWTLEVECAASSPVLDDDYSLTFN